ncbi:MAG: phospholipase [Muribaculaceae bacterium]|nr:phospholipase [Muribaculaceae bacterium]
MTAALIILAALLAVGLVLYLFHKRDERRHGVGQLPVTPPVADLPAGGDDDESPCCGMHVTCERDSLLAQVSEQIEYFDDEELDRFKGRSPGAYSADEAEEFRDVLLTLIPDDIAPWARSIQLRGIELPPDVRDELLMIVAEERARRSSVPSRE